MADTITTTTFQRGRIYNRRADVHARYGGQQQGGISTPAACNAVFRTVLRELIWQRGSQRVAGVLRGGLRASQFPGVRR